MWSSFKYCWTLVSITLVGGIIEHFREDYCELFLNATKISDKSCHNNGTYIVTNEYELTILHGSSLLLNWTTDNLFEWNRVPITNETTTLENLRVLGIRSPKDQRLRPASFYMKKLFVETLLEFEIKAEQFVINRMPLNNRHGKNRLLIKFTRSLHLGQINDYFANSTEIIDVLRIEALHLPGSDLCSLFKFFSLPELKKNLTILTLDVNMTVNMKCFENYRKLKYINIYTPYEPFENLTALICDERLECKFNMGKNGLKCPVNCVCTYRFGEFQMYCYKGKTEENREIPPLPIPPDYAIKLICSPRMQLMQLPNNTLPGYMEVCFLDVSTNNISSIAVYQLPRKLSYLDISHNPITIIDSAVANYLNKHSTMVHQLGIKWIVNCDERALVKLLQRVSYKPQSNNIGFFEKLNGTCPKKCQCCFDQKTENFVIDCSNRAVDFPTLPDRGPNKVTLLLANCSMKELPKNLPFLVKSKNITHLDLRKNYLKYLNEKIVYFYSKHDNTTIELSGNPWSCICKPRSFLFFLRTQNPTEYNSALARCKIPKCPDSCVCCLDNLNSSALAVDCRGQQLTRLPLLPDSVTSLDLRDNDIMEIDLQSQEFLKNLVLSAGLKLFLSRNPWTCICYENDIVAFAKSSLKHIPDYAEMECSNLGKRLALVEESEICPSTFIYAVLLFVFIMTIITILNAFVYFKQPILMWFYEHEICMSMAVRMDLERMKKFDAFLCFTHKDEHLVEDYVERLENGERKFRLCFYLRDWNVGASIPECIIQSVKDSRRIIILMTKNFLESTWGKLEFRLALHATSKDRCKRLIVILYPDVENFDDLDSELKAYMVLNTYLRRDNPNFWNKLLYSMPHIS